MTDELIAAYREERRAIAQFWHNDDPDVGLLDLLDVWDQARERYCRLLAEYAEGIGLSVRKAERGLGAHLAAFEAMEAAR